MEEDRNLLDYLYVLVRWRWFVLLSVFCVSLATAGISLLLPEEWTASTTLLPPEEEAGRLGLSMLLNSSMPGALGNLVGTSTPSERLVTILESRRVLGAMVDRFGLVEEYDAPHRDQAIEALEEQIEKELGGDGTLKIEVRASRPQLAADLANALAAELDAVSRQSKSHQASLLRQFLEARVAVVEAEILGLAEQVRHFQERYGVVDLKEQTSAAVEVVKFIAQELTLLEVKLGVARQQLPPGHGERRLLELEVEELRGQLQSRVGELGEAAGRKAENSLRSLGPPLSELPRLGLEYGQLELDLKIKEQIALFLGARLEEAKYKEALNTPTIQVLDAATPPPLRSAPRRTLIVLVAACASLALSLVLAFALESLGQLSARNREKFDAIRRLMHSE